MLCWTSINDERVDDVQKGFADRLGGGRFPRLRRKTIIPSSYATNANEPLSLADINADTLIPAPNARAAPSFAEGDWINSETLSVKKLRGRVVLVEFWTFACYNCKNTLPSVEAWNAKYRERGLTVVGVHTPETRDEYSIYYVRREVSRLGIKYPVVTDNEYQTWKAYNVAAWPTIFVLDKQGRIRWLHVGEGRYEETENVIKTLLAE
jgi:thiol-disulfide isomerase/thioredoxin